MGADWRSDSLKLGRRKAIGRTCGRGLVQFRLGGYEEREVQFHPPKSFFFFFFNLKMSEREERCRVDGSTEGGRG